MKVSSLFYICLFSFFFFQLAPILFYFVSPLVKQSLSFVQDPVEYFLYLILSLACILFGYFLFASKKNPDSNIFSNINYRQTFFWRTGEVLSIVFFLPCFFSSILIFKRLVVVGYGNAEITTALETLFFYSHLMSLSFLFAGYTSDISPNKLLFYCALIILPRFIITLSGPRFFVFQALLPFFIFIYPLYKAYILKNKIYIVSAFLLLIVLPYFTGNRVGEVSLIGVYIYGSPITYMWYYPVSNFFNTHLVTAGLFSSLFKIDLYDYKSFFDLGGYKIRFDWIYTRLTIGPEGTHHLGTGGNPIYEALTETTVGFILLFVIIGIICSVFDFHSPKLINRFLFPHIVAKIAFFWRGTFVELFDRAIVYTVIFFLAYIAFSRINSKNENILPAQ